MTQLAESSIPTPEVRSSNPVKINTLSICTNRIGKKRSGLLMDKNLTFVGHGGGQVVSVLSDDPSSKLAVF